MIGFARISACGKGLCITAARHTFNLIRSGDGLFRLRHPIMGTKGLGILGQIGISRRTISGRELIVARIDGNEMLAGQRIEPTPILEPWRRSLGDYENTNLGADFPFIPRFTLLEEDGYLFVKMGESRALLKPLSKDEGILLGPLNDGGDTVRRVSLDGEERILYGGYQFKKIAR
jgi:hypothetical protein